ncbi:50S ribosomal protein 6 chloroplastic [Euphorbia peplus]|nr:50S ribosomal protein 6 chloroplastic [Euphorbia peplus]
MSISCSIFGSPIMVVPPKAAVGGLRSVNGGGGRMVIECSSRPQKKATAHHRKTRPRKSQPWDINRKPTVYAPLPELPPDWTLVSSEALIDVQPSEVAPVATG